MIKKKFRPAGAIFDMDGLMLDSEKPMIPRFIQAGKIFGYDISMQMATSVIGNGMDKIRAMMKEEYGPEFPLDDFHRELSRLTTEAFENGIALRPGLLALFDHFSSMGIPKAVATSAGRKRALWKLEKAGILDHFEVIVTRDDVEHGKPAPDMFLKAAELMGVIAADCVGFEDAPMGLKGLHAAGIRSVFIKDMVQPPDEILALVWHRCKDLNEAIELFG